MIQGEDNDGQMPRLTSTADAWTAAAKVGVLVLAVTLPLSTLITFGFYPGGYYDTLRAALAGRRGLAARRGDGAAPPARHVWHGVRDEVPPHGVSTFAVMLAALVAGELVLGHVWTFMAALLVASALLVFRPPAGRWPGRPAWCSRPTPSGRGSSGRAAGT